MRREKRLFRDCFLFVCRFVQNLFLRQTNIPVKNQKKACVSEQKSGVVYISYHGYDLQNVRSKTVEDSALILLTNWQNLTFPG